MNIGVLGTGNIGGTLADKWVLAGHKVVFGARDPAQKQRLRPSPEISFLSVDDAIRASDIILFAVPSRAMSGIIDTCGPGLASKILIDATNDFGAPQVSKVNELLTAAPDSSIYRAFNSLGWEAFENPHFSSLQADLVYCGLEHASSRQSIEQLIADVGLRPVWAGGLEMTEVVDAIGRLWIALAVRQARGRHLAFKVLEDGHSF